jgi:hypothetical protein
MRLDARRARPIAALHHLVRANGDDRMSSLGPDVRYSFRMIRRAPLSSAIVVLMSHPHWDATFFRKTIGNGAL